MSRTSCYKYVLELPTSTLDEMLRAAFSESDTAGISVNMHQDNVPVDGYTATVDASPDDLENHPPTLDLGPASLSLTLHLRMRFEVQVNNVAGLDPIIYVITFDFAGIFEKDVALSRLIIRFPAVTAANLNMTITGGDVPLTPELFESSVHELFQAHPELAHDLQTNVPWPVPGDSKVAVTTDIYDDPIGSPGFRGAISVEVPDQAHIKIIFPGHLHIQGLANPNYVNTNMTVDVIVAVETDQTAGQLRVKLQDVQAADVTVTLDTASIYDAGVKPQVQDRFAEKLRNLGEQTQPIPTQAQIQSLISGQLLALAPNLIIPVFTPVAPAAGEVDLRVFEPVTVNQQVLALQIAPRNDGTLCDTPDVFARAAGFSVAIAAVEVNAMMEPLLAANRGAQHIAGYDMDVEELSGTLSDPGAHGQAKGHIWIHGKTNVHVDCWPDPEIEFEGPIFLVPQTAPDGHVVFSADAGDFSADDPCCADVDPGQIAALIEGDQSAPIALPSHFSGVGEMQLTLSEAEIFADSVVVHGSLAITTLHAAHRQALRRTLFWFNDLSP